MQNLSLVSVAVVCLSILVLLIHHTHAQTVNGLPTCAKECALEFIASSDCPLNNQTCICNYLLFYDACVGKGCNATDLATANEPPVPYYIPEATISIDILPSCSLSTPNFPRPTAPATVASTSARENPPSTTITAPTKTESATFSSQISDGESPSITTIAKSSSTVLMVSTSRERGPGEQTNTSLRQSQTAEIGSTSTSELTQATSTGGAQMIKAVDLEIAVAGLVGFAIVVL
ncbi:hypothetical protein BKA64DRAFT_659450 [Cadophora sp. MPI-SDFR-AT-0126]|nr:hypothetical protein BKA64DRAFT_659450 [Leotiomycetes sp. MPI-SDFR-AT-0126]